MQVRRFRARLQEHQEKGRTHIDTLTVWPGSSRKVLQRGASAGFKKGYIYIIKIPLHIYKVRGNGREEILEV